MAKRLAYYQYCTEVNISPLPLSQTDLGRYISNLSRRLCFSSVRQYLNVVRILYLDAGLPNPLENNWYVKSILSGVKRVKGNAVKQKTAAHSAYDMFHGISA